MVVWIQDNDHFQNMNDFIAFNRSKVVDYSWYHGFIGEPSSSLTIEFGNVSDALLFKLKYG